MEPVFKIPEFLYTNDSIRRDTGEYALQLCKEPEMIMLAG